MCMHWTSKNVSFYLCMCLYMCVRGRDACTRTSENIYSTYYCCVDVCVRGGGEGYTCIMWRSENRFQKSVLCLHYGLQGSNFSSEVELRFS